MTSKADFSADEWDRLLHMPWNAGLLVMIADGSARFLRELLAMAKAVEKVEEDGPASNLIGEMVAEMDDWDPELPDAEGPEATEQLLDELDTAFGIVRDTCSTDEADHVRAWVLGIAQATAEAQKEGGFLGIGGVRVSDAEQGALDSIEALLSSPE